MAQNSALAKIEPQPAVAGQRPARRVLGMSLPQVKEMQHRAAALGGCVSLGMGIPSFETPRFIRDAVIEALDKPSDVGLYTATAGTIELREEIASYLERTRDLSFVDPTSEVLVTAGCMEALSVALSTLVEKGDEVLLPCPAYSSHIEQIAFAEATPVFVPLEEENEWKLDTSVLESLVTEKTKAILVCNPVNPTGTVFTKAQLLEIADFALRHDIYIITDESYDFLTYASGNYFSLSSLPEIKHRLIATFSFSKMYNITGWRVGFLYTNPELMTHCLKVHDSIALCAPHISQLAVQVALENTNGVDGLGDKCIADSVQKLAERRDIACERLDRLSSYFSYVSPEAGYYIFPKILSGMPSMMFALELLHQAKVVIIPGAAFGPQGEGHLRMHFCSTIPDLNEAFDRLDALLLS